jgi:hypothetical protein
MTSYLKNRYCDLTFVFERIVVPVANTGTLPTANYWPLNIKVRAGHNLMPFAGNLLYYYVETQPAGNLIFPSYLKGLPIYQGYDFRQLFSFDPYIFTP